MEVQMSDTSGQPGKSPAPTAKPEGSELLDEGSKDEGSKDVFFDLEDEDEGTTSNSTSHSLSDIWEQGFQEQAQIHKLKNMLKSKSHEQDNMAQQAAETRKKLEEEQTRVGSMEQQLKRACQEKQQSQDLLADTQVKRRSLESRLVKLREKKKWAEQCNTQLESKLQQTLIQCKQLNEKCAHSGELLDMKQIDFDKITKRYNVLESDFEAMVLEKEVKIHELKGSLELAQIRCQQLEPENVRQQQYIKQLEARRATLEHSHAQLNKELLLLRDQEQEALRTVATLSEEKTRQQLRLVQMEEEWGAVKQHLATNYSQLQQKINPLINERDALRDALQEQREQFAKLEQILQSVQFNAEQQAKKQAKCEPENCSSCAEKLAETSSAEIQMSRLQKINKRQAKILKEHYVDVDKANLFDVELQPDDSLTLQSLCARTATVDISTTQQSLLTGLKDNAEEFMAFIKQQEKQGASSDATPTHSNMKHFG